MPTIDDERPGFDLDFEEQILGKSWRDRAFAEKAIRILDVHHFSTPQHAWCWEVIRDSWMRLRESPNVKIVLARARRDVEDDDKRRLYLETIRTIASTKLETPRACLEELQTFVRATALQEVIEEAGKALISGDVDDAWSSLRKGSARDVRDEGYSIIRWEEEFVGRQEERRRRVEDPESFRRVPTGIPMLDKAIGGGMIPGEVGMVMATTNRGKSIALNNFGYAALRRGFNGVHFTFEMGGFQQASRYDSRYTGVVYDRFRDFDFNKDDHERIERKFTERATKRNGVLRIVSMPMTKADISLVSTAIDECRDEMPSIDFVLLDSADHMRSLGGHRELRIDQRQVYAECKGFAQEENLALWTSTHAGREWVNAIATAEASAESYDKSRWLDVILTLNQPKREKRRVVFSDEDEEAPERDESSEPGLVGFLAKNRDGRARFEIPLQTDFARMLIREGKFADEGNDDGA